MPLVWRLAAPTYATILNGEGNRRHGARWNSPGRGVVYCSANLSLCVLETHANIPPELRAALPAMQATSLAVPDDAGETAVDTVEFEGLRRQSDAVGACRDRGDRWLDAGTDLVLTAPSVIVPEEMNVMLNPAHPRMGEVTITATRLFRFDARLAAPP